jgi:hypothetical protein
VHEDADRAVIALSTARTALSPAVINITRETEPNTFVTCPTSRPACTTTTCWFADSRGTTSDALAGGENVSVRTGWAGPVSTCVGDGRRSRP